MPRIDPLQLLSCLAVLLTKDGGILSREEVPRLVNLMTKFSKKLVSKCVYVLILKSTKTELVDMFMAEGGWGLIQTWLQDAVQTTNWDLVREILELLLITPVDVERLKMNILPKLIKSLSRREDLEEVSRLSTQLVHQWLTIVKGSSSMAQVQPPQAPSVQAPTIEEPSTPAVKVEAAQPEEEAKTFEAKEDRTIEPLPPDNYRSSDRDGKVVIKKTSQDEEKKDSALVELTEDIVDKEKGKEDKEKSSSKSSKKSSKTSSTSSKDRRDSKDKDRKKSSSSSRHTSSSSRSKSSSSSKDKSRRDKDRENERDKEKDRQRSSNKSSSSTSKDKKDSTKDKESKDKDKAKQAEKDKDTLAKIKPAAVDKMGRIPKKNSSSASAKPEEVSSEVKKKPFSVGIKKDSEERPKTVKVFNSKMRSIGLEEDIKPAPPRPTKKPTPSTQLPSIPTKRPSPVKEIRDPVVPPEKKIKLDKIDVPERPGAIKLIPPKPKPAMLQESDLFMDALTAATTKKEPKKRKRRPSVSKETVPTSPTSPPVAETPTPAPQPSTSPPGGNQLALKNIAPINFYQDTLSEDAENKDDDNKENNVTENLEEPSDTTAKTEEGKEADSSPVIATPVTPTDEDVCEAKKPRVDGELRGVLIHVKKKGPKKSISWKSDDILVDIRYFELDETERVNVTKTFGDMARMEMSSEREALLNRKLNNEDLMEVQTNWRVPYELDVEDPPAVPGSKSLEKDVQFAREKTVLPAFYFDKRKIPDSPEEPVPENHQMSDPTIIPLDDPESQEIDLRSTPWPEPKGQTPQVEPLPPQQMFQNLPVPYNPQFNNLNNLPPPHFQVMPQNMAPRFPVPGGLPGNFVGPPSLMPNGNINPNANMMPNGNMIGPPNMPNEIMNMNHNMNPNMFPPAAMQDGFGPGPGPDFQIYGPPNMPNLPNQNMPHKNMFPPKNFNNHRGNHNRGGFRRGANNSPNSGGNWVRMGGGNNWKRGGRGGRLCKNVQNHGYCRNRDTCPFIHP